MPDKSPRYLFDLFVQCCEKFGAIETCCVKLLKRLADLGRHTIDAEVIGIDDLDESVLKWALFELI